MTIDTARGLIRVAEFVELCETSLKIQEQRPSDYFEESAWKQVDADITNRLPIIEAIAREVDERLITQLNEHDMAITHYHKLLASRRLLGELEHREEIDKIVNPGPKLAAVAMHHWVWDHAASLWASGHPRDAVRAAAAAIFDVNLPVALNMPKGSAPEALVSAFSTDPPTAKQPRLRIPGHPPGSDDFKNAQQGAQNLGLACHKLVRNLSAHTVAVLDENEALEELAMLSRFARLVTSSHLETI